MTGAKLLLGGKRIARPGWFMQPTKLGRMGIQEFVNKKLVRSGRMAAPI